MDSRDKPTKKDYRHAMSLMAKHVNGVNTLLSQKLIILGVMTGLLSNKGWLSFLQPGSPSHFQTLLEPPYSLDSKAQVPQLLDLLHKKLKVSVPHAEEFVCNHLKSRDIHCDHLQSQTFIILTLCTQYFVG